MRKERSMTNGAALRALAVAVGLGCAGAAAAEEPTFDFTVDFNAEPLLALSSLGAGTVWSQSGFVDGELGGKVVKGAPYSAEAISETVQVLADGNRIVRRSATRLARDGEGRTRQERLIDGQPATVFINDVVAGRRYVLRPQGKRVSELRDLPQPAAAPPVPPARNGEELRSWAESMRNWGRDLAARLHGTSAETASGQRRSSRVSRVTDEHGVLREVRVEVVDLRGDAAPAAGGPDPAAPPAAPAASATPPVPPLPPIPPLPAIAVTAPTGAGTTTALGAREIEGLRVDGTRSTWTIAAGRIGNEKPIEIVSERWYSPELMLVVQTRRVDPRSGEISYRLTRVSRAEPDAALFKVPADYSARGAQRGRD